MSRRSASTPGWRVGSRSAASARPPTACCLRWRGRCARSCPASTSRSAARCWCRTRSPPCVPAPRPGAAATTSRRRRTGGAAAAAGPVDRGAARGSPPGRPPPGAGGRPARTRTSWCTPAGPVGDARRRVWTVPWRRLRAAGAARGRRDVHAGHLRGGGARRGRRSGAGRPLGVPGVAYRPLSPADAGVELAVALRAGDDGRTSPALSTCWARSSERPVRSVVWSAV